MSAQIGSAFAPLPYMQGLSDGPKVTIPVDTKPVTVYRIQNSKTGEFRTKARYGRKWNKQGKVYFRKCDVTSVLNCMYESDRAVAKVVTYTLLLPTDQETRDKEDFITVTNRRIDAIIRAVEILSQLTDKNIGVIKDRLAGAELDINDLKGDLEDLRASTCGYK